MKKIVSFAIAVIVLLSACGGEKGIEVHSAWMRPTAQGNNGAVYFELHNHAATADELIGASSNAAEAVEIHESKMSGDVMEMNMIMSLPLEPYADIVFESGSLHLMLINLKQEVKLNDEIEVVLHFKNHEDITVHVQVKDAAPEGDHTDM